MSYEVYLNNKFWRVLSYETAVPVKTIFNDIFKARDAGELTDFIGPNGQLSVKIVTLPETSV